MLQNNNLHIISKMKSSHNHILLAVFFTLFITLCIADEETKTQQIFIGKQKSFKLTGTPLQIGKYQLNVTGLDVPTKEEKWYLFIMAQPKQKSKQLFGKPSKITIKSSSNKTLKTCDIVQESDSCFVKNSQFDYQKQNISIQVECDIECQFHLMSEIDYAYPLKLNKPFKLDFENTAYSKIFSLDVSDAEDFYELRLMLQPRGFIKYGQPIILLANYGNQVPTQQQHDFKGIHVWDDGQGIFIRKSQMKENKLTILVEGPKSNVVDLAAYAYQKEEKMQLSEYMPEFDWLKGGQVRTILINISQQISHRIKVVVFTGYLQLPQLYKIEQGISQKVSPLKFSIPNQKYGQFEFRLSKQLIQKESLKKVMLKLSARKQTTYIINYARQQQAISTILPYVSQSSFMEPGQIDQYLVKVQELIESTKQKKSSTIQIIIGNLYGNVKPTFYQCRYSQKISSSESLKKCQITANNKNQFREVTPAKKQNRGGQQRFWFDIAWDSFVKKAEKDASQVVFQLVIVVENSNFQGKTSSYEIQYKNKDTIYLLKEGELIRDRVFVNEKRHYKISIADIDATQVRIHCTKISGQAFFIGSFDDPRVNKTREKILPLYGVLSMKIQQSSKLKQIFLQVQGVDNAYYSLTTQIIRKSEANPTKKNSTGYNQLIVRQQIPYQFLIAPLDSIVLQLHATSKKVNLNLKATSAVKLCMTQNLQSAPFAPNCDIQNDYFIDMAEQVIFDKGLIGNIGIKNTDANKNVSIKIKFTNFQKNNKNESGEGNKTQGECQLAAMNQVMLERIGPNGRSKDNDTVHCIEFNIMKFEEVQLIVDVRGEHHYQSGSIIASINGQETIRILSPSHIFSKEEIQTSCLAAKPSGDTEDFCYLKVKIQGIYGVRIRVLAQYTSDAIRLIDGVAHTVHAQITKNQAKYFYMGIHNTQNITVILQNKLGQYKLYANLVPYSQFAQKQDKSIYPTKNVKDVQSSNPFYYLQQTLTVPRSKILEKCPLKNNTASFLFGRKWIDCALLISVYLDGQAEVMKGGKFLIQATQQNRQLLENDPVSEYLQKKSLAFYYFENTVANGTLVIDANNQNKNCLDIYVRKGSQRATAQYNEKHAKASNNVIYGDTQLGVYSITLQANQNCPYTISVSSAKNKVSRIKKGSFSDIKLALNQQAYYLFENLLNETFKIQTLHKTGQVIISVIPVPKDQLQATLKKNLSQITDWTWSNKDSVKISNTIAKSKTANPKFCVNCYYLININAQRPTQASIVIPTPGSQLPITTDSLLKDLLQKDQTASYRVFTQSNSQFQIYVQYGKIQVTIVQSEKETVAFNQTFQSTKAPVLRTFNLSKTDDAYDFLRYIKINIRAVEDSYYSYSVITSADPSQRGPGLKYGLPQYLYLDASKQKCLNGTMTASIDQFLLSFSKSDLKTASEAEIKIRVNGKELSYDKQVGNNEMLLRINSIQGAEANQSKSFDICMKSKTPVAVTLIQSSPLNYWPQKQPIIIKGQNNLTFGAQGKSIIELNECSSRASAEIFSEFNSMKSTNSQIKQRRRNNNLIEFYHYGPVYIKAKSDKATMRWITVDEGEGLGLGYDQYKSSSIRVIKINDLIQIVAEPVRPRSEKQTSSKLVSVKYSFYAAREQMQLYGAMNCGQGVFSLSQIKVDLQKNPEKSTNVVKTSFLIHNDLKPKFQKDMYFLVGVRADVTVKNKKNDNEVYRFYYPYQQVNRESLLYGRPNPTPEEQNQGQIEQSGQSIIGFIGYAIVAVVVIVAAYFAYTKYCKKCLNKKQSTDELGRQMKYFDLTENH